MTNQRQLLTIAMIVLVFFLGGGAFGYFFFYQPIQEKRQTAERLTRETQEQEAKLLGIQKNLNRLAEARKRSLPVEEMVAAREYHDILYQLLQQAKVPAGATVKARQVDNKSAPSLTGSATPTGMGMANQSQQNAKKAYTRVSYEISFSKSDLWSIIDFLQAYYKLNLLQQITSITVKKSDDVSPGAGRRSTETTERKDLNVTLVTEALILDTAENRKSVLPVPSAFAAVGGGVGLELVRFTPELGRRITPQQFVPVLATKPREYSAMIAHDPFHGPLPPPPKPKIVKEEPKEEVPVIPPAPPKPDIAMFIRLVGITQRDDGTAAVEVRDLANNTEYEVHFSPTRVIVRKFVGTPSRRQPDMGSRPSSTFNISDSESSTNVSYKVVGVESDALYLMDAKEKLPPMAGLSAVGGGGIASVPLTPKLFRWKLGQSLRDVKQADKGDVQRILQGTPAIDGTVAMVTSER